MNALVKAWLVLLLAVTFLLGNGPAPPAPRFVHLRGNYSAGYAFEITIWTEPHPDVRWVAVDVYDAVPARSPFADISPEADIALYELGEFWTSDQREVTHLTMNQRQWRFKFVLEEGEYFLVARIQSVNYRPMKQTKARITVT